jgi:hypothetical protein
MPMHVTCHLHFILRDLIVLIILGEEYKLRSVLQPPITSSLCGPNFLPSTLFLNTLSLCASLNVRNQVSHPYNTISKIIVLYVLIITFLDSRGERERFWAERSRP